jgi:hypothetical protein
MWSRRGDLVRHERDASRTACGGPWFVLGLDGHPTASMASSAPAGFLRACWPLCCISATDRFSVSPKGGSTACAGTADFSVKPEHRSRCSVLLFPNASVRRGSRCHEVRSDLMTRSDAVSEHLVRWGISQRTTRFANASAVLYRRGAILPHEVWVRVRIASMDRLFITLIVGIGTLLVGVGCLAAVAWANAASRNLALATATLFAAVVLLVVQLPFELRGKTLTKLFSAEFTIDHAKPQVRQWSYPTSSSSWRIGLEIGASDALAKANPNAFKGDGEKLTRDMTVRSLAVYLFAQQFDWRISEVSVRGPSMGTMTTIQPLSQPTECTIITSTQLEEMLAKAGNAFVSGPIVQRQICLPPNASLVLASSSISIVTPFVRIAFDVGPTAGAMFVQPGTGAIVAPTLSDGTPQYETRAHSIRATTEYAGIRAQHRDIEQYQQWAEHVVNGAQTWFEGSPT